MLAYTTRNEKVSDKNKCKQMKKFLALRVSLSDVVFIVLINVKMPTIVSRIKLCSAELSMKKVL